MESRHITLLPQLPPLRAHQPGLGSALDSTTITGTSYAWYTLDVTAYVQSERSAGRNVISVALHNTATAFDAVIQVNSREATANRPQLVISN